jgi:hypothetical protein
MVAALSSQRASDLYRAGLGLVFTDARGRIVFVDNRFLNLVGELEAGALVGKPLNAVIHVANEAIRALIQDIAHSGYVHERQLTIVRGDGAPVETICTGVATYDDRKAFIGADLTLRDPSQASPNEPATHSDVLGARIQQIEAEADAQAAQYEILAQLYFTSLVSSIQVLLGRMGGPRVQATVEDIVNQRSAKGGWSIGLKGGHFIIVASGVPVEAYHTLLDEVLDYGRNVIGGKMLAYEMRAVDEHMKPETQTIADQYGLREWVG